MCMVSDDDYWEFFHDEHRRAGKPHRCCECRRTIERGEFHRYSVGKWEGGFSTMRQCLHCVEAARWLMVVCSGYLFEAVLEDLGEHVLGHEDYLRTAPLTRLYRWMVAGWHDRAGNLRTVEAVRDVTDKAIAAYKVQHAKAVA